MLPDMLPQFITVYRYKRYSYNVKATAKERPNRATKEPIMEGKERLEELTNTAMEVFD